MTKSWDHIIGLDLTDPFSKARRAIAAAEIRRQQHGHYPRIQILEPIPWPDFDRQCTPEVACQILEALGVAPSDRTLLVLDGPQGLARRGESARHCERVTRAPGRTPDHEPMGNGPFVGYLRASVQLYQALLQDSRWTLLESESDRTATLLEAFPGDAWRRLGSEPLSSKQKLEGQRQRLELLRRDFGVDHSHRLTHDDLDASLCAALGYWWAEGGAVRPVGEPPTFDDVCREGFIITREESKQRVWRAKTKKRKRQMVWGYRATSAQADSASTVELASDGILVRSAFRRGSQRQRIPLVGSIEPGDLLRIVYTHQGNDHWLEAAVDEPGEGVSAIRGSEQLLPAVGIIEAPALVAQLEQLGYSKDPKLLRFTGLALRNVKACEAPGTEIPRGRNAIWAI